MRKIKLWVETGFAGASHEEVVEVDDDFEYEDLEELARDYMFEHIEYGWQELFE